MRGENETIEDIEKKLRELARAIKHTLQMPQAMFERYATIENKQLDVYFAELADRIKAAHKREVDKLNSVIQATVSRSDAEIDRLRREIAELKRAGNAAKLREALGMLRAELWNNTVIAGKRRYELYEIADAAIAAPPRNCDRFPNFNEAIITYAKERPSDQKKWGMMRYAKFSIWLMTPEIETRGDLSPRAKEGETLTSSDGPNAVRPSGLTTKENT